MTTKELEKRIKDLERKVDTLSRKLLKQAKDVTCDFCGYEWNTRSNHFKISCPSCGNKTDNPHANEEPEEPKAEKSNKNSKKDKDGYEWNPKEKIWEKGNSFKYKKNGASYRKGKGIGQGLKKIGV